MKKQRVAVEIGRVTRALADQEDEPAFVRAGTPDERREAIAAFLSLLDALPGAAPMQRELGRRVSREELERELAEERVPDRA